MVTWLLRADKEDYDGAPPPRNYLPARYGKFATSGLTVTIGKGPNEIPAMRLTH